MNKRLLLSISTLLLLSACCAWSNKNHRAVHETAQASVLTIDFQAGFLNSNTILYVESKRIFSEYLTTINTLGYTGRSVEVSASAQAKITGNVKLRLVISGIEKEFTVDIKKGLYIGIKFDSDTGNISFVQAEERFFYE